MYYSLENMVTSKENDVLPGLRGFNFLNIDVHVHIVVDNWIYRREIMNRGLISRLANFTSVHVQTQPLALESKFKSFHNHTHIIILIQKTKFSNYRYDHQDII
jgi:hypothetical protein